MKTIIFMFLLCLAIGYTLKPDTKYSGKIVVDLPEEIDLATSKDTLRCYITNDTLHVEFYHNYK